MAARCRQEKDWAASAYIVMNKGQRRERITAAQAERRRASGALPRAIELLAHSKKGPRRPQPALEKDLRQPGAARRVDRCSTGPNGLYVEAGQGENASLPRGQSTADTSPSKEAVCPCWRPRPPQAKAKPRPASLPPPRKPLTPSRRPPNPRQQPNGPKPAPPRQTPRSAKTGAPGQWRCGSIKAASIDCRPARADAEQAR